MIHSCAHPACRTSLNDETAAYCPHVLPFCEHCVWEDGCDECVIEPLRQRADDAWNAAAQPQPWIDPVRDGAADSAAEARKEERAYALGRLEDREERAS